MAMEHLICVDEKDQPLGFEEKDECHRKGLLHRAIHVLVFNSKGDLLLQKRSLGKKTYPGRWTSSCSGHVSRGESYEEAARRELREEIGIAAEMRESFKFYDDNPIDREIAKVFVARHEGPFNIDNDEVDGAKFFSMDEVRRIMSENPEVLTPDLIKVFQLHTGGESKRSGLA
jgi:isopentenyl-diphosphate delta-isomerase type 1